MAKFDHAIKERPRTISARFDALDQTFDMARVLASAALIHTPDMAAPEAQARFIADRRTDFEANACNPLYVALTAAVPADAGAIGAGVAAGPRFLNGYTPHGFRRPGANVAAGPRFLNGYTTGFGMDVLPVVAAGPRFLNGYTGTAARHLHRWVAAGPRFLNGYTRGNKGVPDGQVAAGPRFLNGYTFPRKDRTTDFVAAGPRFLNGYTLVAPDTAAIQLPLDRDF